MPFQRPETIQCKVEVKNTNTGDYVDPIVDPGPPIIYGMKITITDPDGTIVVGEFDGEGKYIGGTDMDRDGVGKYHYDFVPEEDADLGRYRVRYVATDGAQVTIEDDSFVLEA